MTTITASKATAIIGCHFLFMWTRKNRMIIDKKSVEVIEKTHSQSSYKLIDVIHNESVEVLQW